MINIAKALIEAQKEMGNATKDSNNPFFKSKYADLNAVREACLPALNKHGIAVLQPVCQVEGKNYVKTILLHESGEQIESLTEILFSKQNDAQAQGSGITYARRYGLQSLVCIGAEDDDGNKAAEQSKKIPQKDDVRVGAENFFRTVKTDLEKCSSIQEIEGLWTKKLPILKRLEKNPLTTDLYKLLEECKEFCEDEFKAKNVANELGNNVDYAIAG